ncbi:hypothetical protein M3N64_00425 [Sporolactobacillus sp. CPB3-1]|uniref:Uncharacterized protein n=1 Tax=Sporolactobacillus mangiferae TaxID=2940498 RepID=A0ABT0M6C6_9BACL|nr:hypothetical protein [Sporolactobacillus mangiferae]MCL1630417.1 hypothetical protein [Sporolactobacillus mangiferae]
MSLIWIIGAVISLIFYVAKSVEKQNAEERQRRQKRGRRQMAPSEERHNNRPIPVDSDTTVKKKTLHPPSVQNELAKRYAEVAQRMNRPETVPAPSIQVVRTERSPHHSVNQWFRDRQSLRQAFVFSVCMGKPRAIEPHRSYQRYRKN